MALTPSFVVLLLVALVCLVKGEVGNLTAPVSAVRKSASVARARQYYISNRDSYAEAAGNAGGQGLHGGGGGGGGSYSTVMNSYNAPQNSYAAPSQSYGAPSNSYGVPSYGDDNHSSKGGGGGGGGADIAGLIGLIGLKGLKGVIPLVKLTIFTLINMLPILLPLALAVILLKPVFVISGLGRSLAETSLSGLSILSRSQNASEIAQKLSFLDKFNTINSSDSNGTFWGEQMMTEMMSSGISLGNDILGKDADNQCMQRIACEGVFKSLPRIFFRLLGESAIRVRRRRRDNAKTDGNGKEIHSTARRKDLATLALNRLSNPQYLTKKPSTADDKDTAEVCKQYKCLTLF